MEFLRLIVLSSLLAAAVAFAGAGGQAGRYVETEDYLAEQFPAGVPAVSTLWVSGELREEVEHILGHRFGKLRVRYWYDGNTSLWVLDEIGKELPITIGVTVRDHAIADVRVLEFRESRGWEVKYPFFTEQFRQARLNGGGHLDREIDSITGATLSVSAVTRVAKVALIMHGNVASS
jgi:hypothetical protein